MARLLRLVFPAVIVATSLAFSTQSQVVSSAPQKTSFRPSPSLTRFQDMSSSPLLRIRGGGPAEVAATAKPAAGASAKKVRLDSFDSLRFFLIATIVLGHFVSFAKPSEFVFKFVSQHNIAVGAFFALSGYVTAYTSTEQGKREPSPKLLSTPKPQWILSRIFGYYPLHLVVLALFSPMFLYTDVFYSGWPTALWHGFLSVFLLQSWFPMHAEVWNAPTWYLSALNFITALMPFALPPIARMNKAQLRKTFFYVWLTCILPKIGYFYDFNTLGLVEGVMNPKVHPNMAIFNLQRFSPLYQVAEVLLGVVACRLVMLDDDPDEKEKKVKTNALSSLVPLLAMLGAVYLRGAGIVNLSEFAFRYFFFVPLFLRFLMSLHRNTVSGASDPTNTFLSNKALVWLGNLAFPIYIVHGPIGQVFFKKIIATKVFGQVMAGPQNFAIYLATLLASAWILQKTVLQNKAISNWSKSTVDKLSEAL